MQVRLPLVPGVTDTIANVSVSCQGDGTFAAPAACAWTCSSGYCQDGNACSASKSVPCDANNGNPANSSDTVANVSVACLRRRSASSPPTR